MIAIVKGTEIRKNRDGDHDVLMITAEVGDTDDVQSIELACAMGEDFHPTAGTKLILQEVGSAYKIAVAGDDGISPTTSAGERKVYSIAGDAISAVAYFKADGTIQLNNGQGTAVEFARLKTAFDAFIIEYNAHTHAKAGVGTPTPPVVPSTATIDAAESKTVMLP